MYGPITRWCNLIDSICHSFASFSFHTRFALNKSTVSDEWMGSVLQKKAEMFNPSETEGLALSRRGKGGLTCHLARKNNFQSCTFFLHRDIRFSDVE